MQAFYTRRDTRGVANRHGHVSLLINKQSRFVVRSLTAAFSAMALLIDFEYRYQQCKAATNV